MRFVCSKIHAATAKGLEKKVRYLDETAILIPAFTVGVAYGNRTEHRDIYGGRHGQNKPDR
jgi:hypothetical protein